MKAIHRKVAIGLALVLMLATAAVATAASGSKGSTGKGAQHQGRGPGPGGPGGPGGPPFLRDMTSATVNVYRDGKTTTLKLDNGKVKSVAADSITITEKDGKDVTIATDSDTKVKAGPGKTTALSDLKAGQAVGVERPDGDGQAADEIHVMPKPGQKPPAPPTGTPPTGATQ